MDKFGRLTGRHYRLFEYFGDPEAEQIIVIMASGAETVLETMEYLQSQGEKVGLLQIRLYRPFDMKYFLEVLPESVRTIAVLDRTKEPGSIGEPLYLDVSAGLTDAFHNDRIEFIPQVIGGRYGLSSKEFTPAMVKTVFDELKKPRPKNHFTIGIIDDVCHTSLAFDSSLNIEPPNVTRAMFYGLGADGTVGANKNSIKIIGENTDLFAQGYFVYDSRKSGSQTVSHLRFGDKPIRSPYLITSANFIACHQFGFIMQTDVLKFAQNSAVFLLNSPYSPDETWDKLPKPIQQKIIDKQIDFYVIDATEVAKNTGMGRRINTIMQTCFFALSGVLPRDEAIQHIKKDIEKSYFTKGQAVIDQNFKAVDATLDHLHHMKIPDLATATHDFKPPVPVEAPEFIQKVTAAMLKGEGDDLPVSMIPEDGTYPTGTTQWEKRSISDYVPAWDETVCIQCGKCSFVCPHGVIRAKFYNESYLDSAPASFRSAPINPRGFPETRYSLQVYLEDCTGCVLCVEACPAFDPDNDSLKAINMKNKAPILDAEKKNITFFESLPVNRRSQIDFSSVRGAQFLEPLFEFSGACAGCGETPYVKLLSQLFGPRLIVANATECSSIYSGNLPTTPWTVNKDGIGPAWSNSLFEDNAEFGLGMRVTADKHLDLAKELIVELKDEIGETLIKELLECRQSLGSDIRAQRVRVGKLKEQLKHMDSPKARNLETVVNHLVRRSIWIVGGDGWAYDIGSAGLDHVLASGRNINILVMDTEVYSNTGGQMSKATPIAATAGFASAGKTVGKKDLAMQAISYGDVYVARVASGANPQQTLLAFREAEEYTGPSLILAYSHCIAHGYNIQKGLDQQNLAVASGYWPLIRYNPTLRTDGQNPFVLDSPRPRIDLKDFAYNEMRYKILTKTHPENAEHLMEAAQKSVDLRWATYEMMAALDASGFSPVIK